MHTVLGKLRSRLESNTEMDLKVIGFKDVGCIHVVQDRVQ
jgi:hypothetical protein